MEKDNYETLELSSENMRNYGYKIIDAIADHMSQQASKKAVAKKLSREEMDKKLKEEIPWNPQDREGILSFVVEEILANSNIVSHPKSFSFVPGPSNFISAMADSLAAGFNIFSGGWSASPSAATVEIVCIDWLLQIFGLPVKKGGGLFTSGGSMANLTALATARKVKCQEDFSKSIIYLSDQAHSSNIKAIRILGFAKEQIRIIPTDMEFKMGVNKLKNAIAKDKLEGLHPFCIIATAGTTNTGTIDPLLQLAAIGKKEDLWVHVDAAYGGAGILSSRDKKLFKGIERVDSITVDPHKWFYQPYEMGCLLVRNHKWLSGTFTEKPEYLRDIEGNTSEINFYDHGIELTRRFRALKFYMSVKSFGMESFRKAIEQNIRLAEEVEEYLRQSKHWEVISPAQLAIINFRYHPLQSSFKEAELDRLNQLISERVVLSREALLVTTVLNKQVVLRMCLINPRTKFADVKETLDLCESIALSIANDWVNLVHPL
jgi:glutamate/tyrosine decarboxylase-like PLP-dependent enzyme